MTRPLIVKINGKNTIVFIDRIQSAFTLTNSLLLSPSLVTPPDSNEESPTKTKQPIVTRSGRHVHFPKKFTTMM